MSKIWNNHTRFRTVQREKGIAPNTAHGIVSGYIISCKLQRMFKDKLNTGELISELADIYGIRCRFDLIAARVIYIVHTRTDRMPALDLKDVLKIAEKDGLVDALRIIHKKKPVFTPNMVNRINNGEHI